jgi:two-component system nitrate/nitrite response regulator NarL
MQLYLIGTSEHILNHWASALKKFKPIKMDGVNTLNRPYQGVIFCLDTHIINEDMCEMLREESCKVIVMSMLPDFLQAQEYIRKGAVGYGNAMMHETHLASAYHAALEGKIWLYPDFINMLIMNLSKTSKMPIESHDALELLSLREKEVALLLAQGLSHLEISEDLVITVRTVKAHCTSIYEKLGVKDRLALSVLLHS